MRNEGRKNRYDFKAVIQDLCSRFILNCPEEEYESFERIFFQIEEAHWFYEDFYREQDKTLPYLSFRVFAVHIFNDCPLLKPFIHSLDKHLESFIYYKRRVNVCGAIILNETMDKVLLVKGWSAKTWGFPKGKINKNETAVECAVREVKEEIGYDISNLINPNDLIELDVNEQKIKLYIVHGVKETENFETLTRKEISKIEWHNLHDIGKRYSRNRYWTVLPFLREIKKWISIRRKKMSPKRQLMNSGKRKHRVSYVHYEERNPTVDTVSRILFPEKLPKDRAAPSRLRSGSGKSLLNFSFNTEELIPKTSKVSV
jgi:mRNA-decapping enzyme subunit 2